MKIIKIQLRFVICSVLLFTFACATQQKNSANEVGFIDPDQKALPKDGSFAISHGAVTDTTLDGKGEVIAPATTLPPSPEVAAAPSKPDVVAPKNNEAVSDPEVASTAEADSTVSETVQPASQSQRSIGTGPHTRYIKAKDLNIRSQPNRFSKITGMLNGGDKVHVTIIGGWAKLEEGQWIRSRWLSKSPPKVIVGVSDREVHSEDGDHDHDHEPAPTKKVRSKSSRKSSRR